MHFIGVRYVDDEMKKSSRLKRGSGDIMVDKY